MDLDPIGEHCALQSCNVLDFLPIQCGCLRWFCRLHIAPDLHDCSSVRHRLQEESSARVRSKCALLACNKPCIATGVTISDPAPEGGFHDESPRGCPSCQHSFCVDHRHMQSHACTGLTIEKDGVKNEAARAILAKKILATSVLTSHVPMVAHRPTRLPSDPQKLARLQRLNLMKLHHKAVPGDPRDRGSVVSVEQRIHITVRFESLGQPAKEAALWFRKGTVTGKALDLAVQHFGLSHTTPALHLKQLSAEIGDRILQNHLELSAQLEDGSTVILTNSQPDG